VELNVKRNKEVYIGYTQVALEDRILEMYPQIRKYGLSPRLSFDEDKNAWIIKFKKDHREFTACLDKEDADACMDNTYCEAFESELKKILSQVEEKKLSKHLRKPEDLSKLLIEWQGLEKETISLAEQLRNKSDNDFVKLIMEMIRHDSEKHKVMQQFVIDHLTKEAFRLTPEDLIPLGEVLEKHVKAEAKSMALANTALIQSKDFFSNFIISYLMADEIKHHEMLTKLDQIKGKVYPYGVVRAE
jgi:hypothetical protein